MNKKEPFSQEDLNEIFKISPSDSTRVTSRESSSLEFKESFGWKSLPKYLKTCAAFANTKGGYIVFGIADRPRTMVGLSGAVLEQFRNIDPERMSSNFNDCFSPEIKWDIQEYEINDKNFGLLYIYESSEKPVICKKDADKELKEGDIYYRYRGRSQRIKYPELRSIMDEKRENEQQLWMHHLSQIARIGVRDAGIFDLHTGEVTGTSSSFLIEESLLSQLSFIKEGEFSEVKGKPALKLIGNVEPVTTIVSGKGRKQIIKTKGIRIGDIVMTFLNHEKVSEPLEYIRQICFESTAFLPIYYYMKIGELDRAKTVELLNGVVSRSTAKTKLIERLTGETPHQKQNIPKGNSYSANRKREFADQIKNNTIDIELSGKDLEYCIQSVRTLSVEDVKKHSEYLRYLLKNWFNKHYASASITLADNLRRAVCWLDEALYVDVNNDHKTP